MPNLGEPYRPRSSQRVSLSWEEDQASESHRRLMQVQFAEECIETKTVTTTTTTKRAYPPLFVRGPRDLNSLDSKEYPLASRPTPPSLRKLTFHLGDEDNEPSDTDDAMDLVSKTVPLTQRPFANTPCCRCAPRTTTPTPSQTRPIPLQSRRSTDPTIPSRLSEDLNGRVQRLHPRPTARTPPGALKNQQNIHTLPPPPTGFDVQSHKAVPREETRTEPPDKHQGTWRHQTFPRFPSWSPSAWIALPGCGF